VKPVPCDQTTSYCLRFIFKTLHRRIAASTTTKLKPYKDILYFVNLSLIFRENNLHVPDSLDSSNNHAEHPTFGDMHIVKTSALVAQKKAMRKYSRIKMDVLMDESASVMKTSNSFMRRTE
jgi:hypothetical protein